MTETKNDESVSVAPEDEELSEESLDEVLNEADPEFLKTVQEIGDDKNLSLSQIIITDAQQALNEERDAWVQAGKLARTFYRIFPAVARISLLFKKVKFAVFSFLMADWIRIKNFLYFLATDGKNQVTGAVKKRIHALFNSLDDAQRNFRFLSWKMKSAFLGVIILVFATGLFIYRSVTRGVIPQHDDLFITSLERVATDVFEYDPENEVEPFYDNLRASGNILLLPKMVVNLKKSTHSGGNPMGAFEFFVEGMAPEVIIEVKDRETEIRDLMQRTVEEFTFDQVDSVDGKKLVCERLKRDVNNVLTTGKIRKVWVKTAIIKP